MYRDWSRTSFLRGDDEDYTMTTRGRMMERLQVILAGRAAEEIAFTSASSYSINDLKVCSQASHPCSLLPQERHKLHTPNCRLHGLRCVV